MHYTMDVLLFLYFVRYVCLNFVNPSANYFVVYKASRGRQAAFFLVRGQVEVIMVELEENLRIELMMASFQASEFSCLTTSSIEQVTWWFSLMKLLKHSEV